MRPDLAFIARLPCGSFSSRRIAKALSIRNRAASSTTKTSVSSASTSGLPASSVMRFAMSALCASRICWKRRNTRTRLRMPQAFQSGCAARAWATAARTSVGPAPSSSPRTSPVAGFTEAMRDTAYSTSVAICEEVYAGRRGRARELRQYSTSTRYNPLAGAVGPAADRARASRMPRKSSRLTVPFPICRNVPTRFRTM